MFPIRLRLVLVCSFLFTLVSAHHAFAQCRVVGELRSADGTPIAGATVRVESPSLRPAPTATTDANGRYAVENVTPGIWAQITAVHQNGRVLAQAFTLVTQLVETVDLEARRESISATTAEDLDPLGGPSADIRGRVSSPDGAPVAGATVSITGTPVMTSTDSAGRFAFASLRASTGVELDVTAAGYAPARTNAIVPGKGHTDVSFALEPSPGAAGETAIDSSGDDRSIRVRRDDLARIPTVGRHDVFRALQFLPSVAAAQETSSELYVRGGTPDQTGISLDGFTIYPIRHSFGVFSALNTDAVERADFAPTSGEAAHGSHLAGTLGLTGAAGDRTAPSGAIDLSILGLAMKFSVPIGTRGSVLLAGRRSPPSGLYTDALDYFYGTDTAAVRERPARFSGGSFAPPVDSPSFYDLNGKLQFQASSRDRLTFTLYNARDVSNTSHDIPVTANDAIRQPDPAALPEDAAVQVSSVGTWRGRGAAASWTRRWSPSAATLVTAARSEFSNDADAASVVTGATTGVDYSFAGARGGSQALSERNAIRDTTVRVVNSIAVGFEHAVSAGVEVASLDSTYRASTEAFQHDATSGRFTSSLVDLLHRDTRGVATTLFAQDAYRPLARLTVTPGVRVTRFDFSGETYVDPRVNAAYLVRPQVRLTGGFTVDHQLANRIVHDDLARGDTAFWTLADGTAIAAPRARQGFVGVAVDLPAILWSAQAYYRRLDDLTVFEPDLFPGVAADPGSPTFYHGSGRAMGVETLLQHHTERNTLSTSLTLARAEYTFPSLESATFRAPFDRPFELNVTDTARFHSVWSVSGVWVLASGRPYTPVTGAESVWFPSGETVSQMVFGDRNSKRLPVYHRLDLSGQRDFAVGMLKGALGGTVFNVYGRRNIAYTEHEVINAAVTSQDVLLMRRAVNVFVRFTF